MGGKFFSMPRKLARDRKGVVAAEFGLVMPLFLGMFMGMTEYSFVYFTYGAMQAATRDVTRQVAVNTIPVSGAEAEIKSRLPGWMADEATVVVTQTTPTNPATNVFTMETLVPISKASPFRFYTIAQTGDIAAMVEMKQELPFVEVK